jgi:hypothetical protein
MHEIRRRWMVSTCFNGFLVGDGETFTWFEIVGLDMEAFIILIYVSFDVSAHIQKCKEDP